MSFSTLITLTVVEILLLVVVLAIFLILLTRRLRSIAATLSNVAWGVRAVEVEVGAIGPALQEVNGLMGELGNSLLPSLVSTARQLTQGAPAAAASPAAGAAPPPQGGTPQGGQAPPQGGQQHQNPWEQRFGGSQ